MFKLQFLSHISSQVLNNSPMWPLAAILHSTNTEHFHPSESSLGSTILEKGNNTPLRLAANVQIFFLIFFFALGK